MASAKNGQSNPKQEAMGQPQEFIIQKLYIKDLSFESPSSPTIFRADWQPKLTLDLNVNSNKLDDVTHHVVLTVTATVVNGDKTAFLAEVNQAGIFTIKNFGEEQLHHLLGSYCPAVMFPYARETISSLVERGGFPPLYLAPINFDALYQQEMEKRKAENNAKAKDDAGEAASGETS